MDRRISVDAKLRQLLAAQLQIHGSQATEGRRAAEARATARVTRRRPGLLWLWAVFGGGGESVEIGLRWRLLAAALTWLAAAPALAEPPGAPEEPIEASTRSRTGLGFRIRGGALHSLDSGVGGDGDRFDATRVTVDGAVRYAFTEGSFFGVSLGYNWDGYGFSPGAQIGGEEPWDQVQTLRISTPFFWEFGEKWEVLAIPIVRLTAENTGDWGDAVTGGGIFGFSYRFCENLRLGPGIGFFTQIEDDANVFPVIVVDWQITERLRFETGRSLGATEGPGVRFSYAFRPWLQASLGFRYERLRFRLASNMAVLGDIGQDESFPLLAGLTVGYPFAQLSLVTGAKLGGKLRIDDPTGVTLIEESYDPAFTIGATFQLLF